MDLMHLAHLFYQYGQPERSLTLAYKLRKKYQRNPDIRMGYFGLLIRGKFDDEIHKPKIIDNDAAFRIENELGEHKILIIDSEDSEHLLAEQISATHEIAKVATGKSVGDKIIISTNPFQQEEWKIVSIKSKYLHLLHKTSEEYTTLFPQANNFWALNLKPQKNGKPDFGPLLKSLDNKNSWVLKAEEMYKKQNYPIGVIARLLGADPIDVWRGFMRLGRVNIRCCVGNEKERQEALDLLLQNGKTPVVDPLTLYSICSLGIQDNLINGFGALGITQSDRKSTR